MISFEEAARMRSLIRELQDAEFRAGTAAQLSPELFTEYLDMRKAAAEAVINFLATVTDYDSIPSTIGNAS